MTPRQSQFVAEYTLTRNATQAAVAAGYSPRTARQTGSDLLSNPYIRALVAQHEAEAAKRLAVTRERVLAALGEAIDVAREQRNPAAMIAAWREIARMCGFYASDRVVRVDINIAAKRRVDKLETRSDAELLEMVGEASCQN
jgi:phage terminase small subunit